MTNFTIDNGDNGELMRSISWQYDHAERLVGLVAMMRDFFNQSTKDFWDGFTEETDISDPLKATDASLARWGALLGVERPIIDYGDGVSDAMSAELYRRILVGRYRLMNSNASHDAYLDYVKQVFGGDVKVSFDGDMSVKFEYTKDEGDDGYDDEVAKAILQYPNVCFAFPAGVEDDTPYGGQVFGFAESQSSAVTADDPILPKFDGAPFSWF